MPYDSQVDRSDAGALIPEDVSHEILRGVQVKSAALQLFKHRTMTRAQQRMPVLSLLPTAYFVNGDVGLKQTTEVNWANKYLDAEEIACIVPIPEKVLDDVDYDLWAEIKPDLEEAVAVALDDAIFFGTNKPSSWPSDIVTAAVAAGNTVTLGTSSIDYFDDINNAIATVEADGYEYTGAWARKQFQATLRGLRDSQKGFLYPPSGPANTGGANQAVQDPGGTLFNERLIFSRAGLAGFATASGKAAVIVGDWSQGIIGIRQDLTFKMLDQAVLTDSAGNILYNLPQMDMVAMRVVARFAFQVPNPINRMQQTAASRYPFAVAKQA